MHDRGRLESVRRAELAQDVRDVHARRLDADHQRRRDLAVRVAAGDERQNLCFPRSQSENLLDALNLAVRPLDWRREIEPRALGEQLDLPE